MTSRKRRACLIDLASPGIAWGLRLSTCQAEHVGVSVRRDPPKAAEGPKAPEEEGMKKPPYIHVACRKSEHVWAGEEDRGEGGSSDVVWPVQFCAALKHTFPPRPSSSGYTGLIRE